MVAFRAASANNGASATTGSYPVTLPTGWAAGDLVLVQVTVGAVVAAGFSPLTGWTITHVADQNSGGATHTTAIAARVMQSGDTNPTFTGTGGGKWAWSAIAIQPGAGEALSIGVDAAVVITTTTSTTLAAPNATTTSTSDVSVLFYGTRATTNSATAVVVTAPTGWTKPAAGESSTAVGTTAATRQAHSAVAYKDAAGGVQTPATGTSNVTTCQNAYHYRIVGSTTPTPLPPPVTLINDAALASSVW